MALWLVVPLAHASERGAVPVEVFDPQAMEGATMSTDLAQMEDGRLLVANMRGLFRYDGARWQLFVHPKSMGGMEGLVVDAEGRIHTSFNGDIGYWKDDGRGGLDWHSELGRLPDDCKDVADETQSVRPMAEGTLFVSATRLALLPRDPSSAPVCRAIISVGRTVSAGADILVNYGVPTRLGRLDANLEPQPVERADERAGVIDSVPWDGGALLLNVDGQITHYRDGRSEIWSNELLQRFQDSPTRPFRTLAKLSDAHIAVAGMVDGVFILGDDGRLLDHLDATSGVPGQRMTHDLLADRHGDLWLAQERSIARVGASQVLTLFDERHGLPSATQLARWRGELVVVSRAGLRVLRETPAGGTFHQPLPGLLGLNGVAALGDDVLLVTNAAVHAVRRTGDAWSSEQLRLELTPVSCIEPSRFNPRRAYVGHATGVTRIDRLDDGRLEATAVPGFDSHVVRIAEQDADTLWVAGRVSGASRISLGSPEATRHYGAAEGLPEGTVRLFGGPRRVWFTTLEGLRVHDPASDRFVVPTGLPPELARDRLYSAYEDHEGHLWVRGGAILNDVFWREGDGWRIDRDVLHAVDPFPTIFGFMREDSVVWAIRATGLLRIDLDARVATPAAPPVIPTRLVDTRTRGALPLAGLAALGPDVRDLRVEFALPFLRRGAATVYRSRLRGFEGWSDWTPTGQQGRIYTNLPDGEFAFEVEARDALQREQAMPPLRLVIPSPWYRTTAAHAAYVLVALGLLWSAMRLGARRRQRQMSARQRELENLVAARTAELAESNHRLEEQATKLLAIDRLKTRFFVNVGHEFRTPLTLVLGPLDDLLRDARERISDRVRDQLQLAHRNARRVLDLIVELLDVNRLEQGQWTMDRAPHDLVALLGRVAQDCAPLVERFGQTLAVDLGGFRQAVGDIDPLQVERALGNLVGNAAKYSPRGTTIDLVLSRSGDQWHVAVRDHGRGIAAEALPHVFDRFFQSEDGDRASGYGIGLSLVREIALAHGGDVTVSSAPGLGSTFVVVLPVAQGEFPDASTTMRAPVPRVDELPPSATGEAPVDGRQRVLIVDDHDDLRLRVRELLQHRFDVIEAADGESAWRRACEELPDLVVSDVMMPGCDGVELTRRLRGHGDTSAVGILLLTAKVGSEHAVAGLAAGANDYLAKPFDASELIARCEAIVAHARRLRHRLAAAAAAPAPEIVASLPRLEDADARWRQRLEQHVAANLHDPAFGVEALADRMHVDRSQLFRRCKETIGDSPSDILREARLAQGLRLLEQGAGNVSEIAYASGFESLSSFTRAFRARFGIPPSQARARTGAVR
jgi:signal transduction histidine kinase/CheY-like chemotaxis protein